MAVQILLDGHAGRARSGSETLSLLSSLLGPDSLRFWTGASPGEESLHAKFVVADQARALVTSANMTGRAVTPNTEAGICTDSPRIIEGLTSLFSTLWASEQSLPLSPF